MVCSIYQTIGFYKKTYTPNLPQFDFDFFQYNKNNSFIPPHISLGLDDQPDKIPIDIYYSSIYYSLAQLCVYIFLKKQIKDEEDYDKVSGPFIYTSLYWCLKRCLDKDENKRIRKAKEYKK